jgi:hypothetical protein
MTLAACLLMCWIKSLSEVTTLMVFKKVISTIFDVLSMQFIYEGVFLTDFAGPCEATQQVLAIYSLEGITPLDNCLCRDRRQPATASYLVSSLTSLLVRKEGKCCCVLVS